MQGYVNSLCDGLIEVEGKTAKARLSFKVELTTVYARTPDCHDNDTAFPTASRVVKC